MKKLNFLFVVLLSCSYSMYMLAYVNEIIPLLHPISGQLLFLMSDCHKGKQQGSQRDDILTAAQQLNAHIIVEDMAAPTSSSAGYNSVKVNFQKKYDAESPLLGLIYECYQRKIPSTNIECRQILAMSYPGSHYAGEIKEQMIDRQKFNDGEQFNKYYKKRLEHIKKMFDYEFFTIFFNSDKTLALTITEETTSLSRAKTDSSFNFFVKKTMSLCKDSLSLELTEAIKYSSIIKELFEYLFARNLGFLIEINILHASANLQSNQPVFICAGEAHIHNILPLLLSTGYTLEPQASPLGPSQVKNCTHYEVINIKKYFDTYIEQFQNKKIGLQVCYSIAQLPTIQ